jgi:hypothetical protein
MFKLKPKSWPAMLTTALMVVAGLTSISYAGTTMHLVKDGQATSVIVQQNENDLSAQEAIRELQYHVKRATGVELPVVTAAEADALPADHVRVVMGQGAVTRKLKVSQPQLGPESYRIYAKDNYLVFVGVDRKKGSIDPPDTNAVAYAVYHFLDHQMGVRWLWPGDEGTHVPKTSTLSFNEMDITHQPKLLMRRLRIGALYSRDRQPEGTPRIHSDEEHAKILEEATAWSRRQQMGTRSNYKFGHSFGEWYKKYHETRPEVLAKPPAGSKLTPEFAKRIKLCVSNPLTAQTIIEEWKAAGAPNNWNVSPNDGSPGFCTCENCRAMDTIDNHDLNALWNGGPHNMNLTGRYIRFWNILLAEMRKTNPEVTLSSYGYSYYSTPEPGFKFHDGMVLGIVDSFDQKGYDTWKGWYESNAKLYLRPNWFHTGAMAPVYELKSMGKFFQYAVNHGMIGFDMDSLMGYWATQGPSYYLLARLSARPELTVEQVIDEYTSGFGSAQSTIREYIQYWEDFTEAAGYTVVGGGTSDSIVKANAPYTRLLNEKKLPTAPLIGGWPSLPLLYTPEVMAKAYAILDKAQAQLKPEESYELKRIEFLRDGLRHLELSRDVIELGYPQLRPQGATRADFRKKAEELQRLRAELSRKHVIWGEQLYAAEVRRRAPTLESRLGIVGNNLDWE